ncbi:hypothetical protein [Sporosarcina sp. G11-34]|uniref:hypothetical protein n=1 Tax=Sporosarcina sp. G11-34 TaxID=2849605 RepID=UPI0022A96C7A|nr:hypothetical protein [Sporosarcina sp. G11-34]
MNSFTIQGGESTLTFIHSDEPAAYHFAFNIYGNQMESAKNWLDGRVFLNLEDGRDEHYYKSFDADAIYFEDPAGNVVEFIGRRYRKVIGDFSTSSILDISEISITTPFVMNTAKKIAKLGIQSRNDNPIKSESLNFLGAEDWYIILVPPNRRWYFSRNMSITCPLEIELFNHNRIIVDFDGNITISEDHSSLTN